MSRKKRRDLTVGMLEMPYCGCDGYVPDEAKKIMKNAVLHLSAEAGPPKVAKTGA